MSELWMVGLVTTTGARHELAVHAPDEVVAIGRAFGLWLGEPIARWSHVARVSAW